MARLATPADITYIIERAATIGQHYAESMALQLATSPDCICAVDPDNKAMFWGRLDRQERIGVAGPTIAPMDTPDFAQTKALYRLVVAEAEKRIKVGLWPRLTALRAALFPGCTTQGRAGAETIAAMTLTNTDAKQMQTYDLPWADLVLRLGPTVR